MLATENPTFDAESLAALRETPLSGAVEVTALAAVPAGPGPGGGGDAAAVAASPRSAAAPAATAAPPAEAAVRATPPATLAVFRIAREVDASAIAGAFGCHVAPLTARSAL